MAAPFSEKLVSLANRLNKSYNAFSIVLNTFLKNGPPPSLAVVTNTTFPSHTEHQNSPAASDPNSIFGGVLLAVQRARRTIEKRLKRKHAFTGHYEHAMPKRNIIPCLDCGNFREKGHLCQHCYDKVRTETKAMQEKMGEDLTFHVPEKEVVYVYEGESISQDGKFVVDMEKPRPSWFSRKLLSKTD